MAIDFVSASSQRVRTSSTPVTVDPFTMCIWAYVTDDLQTATFAIANSANNNNRYMMLSRSDLAGDPVQFRAQQSTPTAVTDNQNTSTTITKNVWEHHAANASSDTTRSVYLNGGGKNTSVTSVIPSGNNRISIGAPGGSSPANYFDGRLGHAAIWSAALTDQEIASLAAGVSALRMRRDSLVYFAPLNNATTIIDIVGQLSHSIDGGPLTLAEGPSIPWYFLAM